MAKEQFNHSADEVTKKVALLGFFPAIIAICGISFYGTFVIDEEDLAEPTDCLVVEQAAHSLTVTPK